MLYVSYVRYDLYCAKLIKLLKERIKGQAV